MITPVHAFACTAVYVGSEVSADGTMIIAKSNDYQDVWANYVAITERVDNMPGRTIPVDNDAAVLAELPATTYRLFPHLGWKVRSQRTDWEKMRRSARMSTVS